MDYSSAGAKIEGKTTTNEERNSDSAFANEEMTWTKSKALTWLRLQWKTETTGGEGYQRHDDGGMIG